MSLRALPPEDQAERLRRIEAVTDVELHRLEFDEMLCELLERVRKLLAADTATVLLLDDSGERLVATAAVGLEDEVFQGVVVPIGAGFAGRVAAAASPVILDDVSERTVVNPILIEKGLRSLLGAPLMAEGRVLGVVHVGSLSPGHFGADDIEVIQLVADRFALATASRRSRIEREAAEALQRSLFPARPPNVEGLEVAARYVPGEEGGVSGDWYDVFALPGGGLGVVIGDVVGRGLRAAVVMGRLRTTLRAHALDVTDPAEVLARLDRNVQHFEPDTMATVLYAVVDQSLDLVEVASAGHFPPLLAHAGAPAESLDISVDPPIGVRPGIRRVTTTVRFEPGDLLCLFTDGLVERRHVPIDDRLELLRELLVAGPPELVCGSVMRGLVGSDPPGDDIALLTIRRTPA